MLSKRQDSIANNSQKMFACVHHDKNYNYFNLKILFENHNMVYQILMRNIAEKNTVLMLDLLWLYCSKELLTIVQYYVSLQIFTFALSNSMTGHRYLWIQICALKIINWFSWYFNHLQTGMYPKRRIERLFHQEVFQSKIEY